jgi:hypothetical protein
MIIVKMQNLVFKGPIVNNYSIILLKFNLNFNNFDELNLT